MRRIATWTLLALALPAMFAPTLPAQTGSPVSRTFAVPLERAWAVTESVLKSLGWDIDTTDRAVGWIVTDSRGVEFKDFGVYGDGTRHKLRLTLKSAAEGRTTISVERELWKEERILWMKDRKPIQTADRGVETAVLDAIEKNL